MALPASGPISGSQISAELGTSATNISLGGMADTASFSAPDAYSDFYGYSSLTAIYGTLLTSKFSEDVCSDFSETELWHNGSNDYPVDGDQVFTDSSGNTAASWVGFKGFGLFNAGPAFNAGTISGGYISDAILCFPN